MRTDKRETISDEKLSIGAKAALCVFLAVFSFFVLGKVFSNPETFAAFFRSIDEKVSTTLKLTASATAASAGISAIPDDIGTPIAEKLADFSEYGFFIICILYAEKYLMTILGGAAFRLILPIGCFLYLFAALKGYRKLERFTVKVVVVSVALFLMIPLGVKVSDKIYETYQASIDSTLSQAENLTADTALLEEAKEDQNAIQAVFQYLGSSANELANRASRLLNRFMESLAVLVVTACLIPLAVILFSLWIVKQFLGVSIPLPAPRSGAGRRAPGEPVELPETQPEEKEEVGVGV